MNGPSPIDSYDSVPYLGGAYAETHPDRISAIAHLFAMQPPAEAVDGCRVLELGCAQGGNIIPMAEAMPFANFYGVDSSRRQVEAAIARICRLNLTNIRIEQQDFTDFPGDAGLFHYIIAHGVYSWIAPSARDHLLEICRRHLAPNGLVYVSYNVLPGWYHLLPVRDLLMFHLHNVHAPRTRVERALAMLDSLKELSSCIPLGSLLEIEEIRRLSSSRQQQATFLAHDLLEQHNEPLLFRDFVKHAAAHGLRYLTDFEVHKTDPTRLGSRVADKVAEWSLDRITAEQYTDFLVGRRFRKSLLCHKTVTFDPQLQSKRLRDLFVASPIRCESAAPSLIEGKPIDFRTRNRFTVTAEHPLTKAALLTLSESWPEPLAWHELLTRAASRLGVQPSSTGRDTTRDEQELLRCLATMFARGILLLFSTAPRFDVRVSARPFASPLARLQAVEGDEIVNRIHEHVEMTELQRELLRLLGGSRSRDRLLDDWTSAVLDKQIALPGIDVSRIGHREARDVLATGLDRFLDAFARAALLLPDAVC